MQALQRLGTLGAAIALTLSAGTAKAALVINQQGALTARDAVFEDGSLYDQYTFSGRSGQQVIISLESQEFDPYLILLDPDRRRINENDDVSRNNRNSRLVVTLPTTGTYTAVANSYESGKNGRYTIKVEVSDGQSSARRAIAREMAAAAVPDISSRCNAAVLSAIDNIEQGRDIGVLVDAERLSDRFRTVPAARPNGINMGLGGPAALSVMFSPQFLTYISSTLMRDCTTVGAVVYSATEAGFERTFGYLPGREATASSVPVGEFTCLGASEGREKPEWGTRLCL